MKRLLSFILILVLLASCCVPVQATGTFEMLEKSGYTFVKCSDKVTLAFRSTNHNHIKCITLFDEEVISESIYDRASNTITTTPHSTSVYHTAHLTPVTIDLSGKSVLLQSSPLMPCSISNATNLGSISYRYYVQGGPMAITLNIFYEVCDSVKTKVDINGRYRDIGALALFLVSLVGLNYASATKFALVLFGRLGLAEDALNVFIPHKYIDATEYPLKWYAKYNNTTGSFTCSKFKLTQKGYGDKVYYSDNYFDKSCFTNRNQQLAYKLHDCINVYWGDGPFDVIKWKNASKTSSNLYPYQ